MMFREKYKKENENIVASEELMNKTKNMMIAEQTTSKKKPVFKMAITGVAIAAVVCFGVMSGILPNYNNLVNPQQTAKSNNFFTLTAYAMEGDTPKQIEFSQSAMDEETPPKLEITASMDGSNQITLYKNLGFKCQGENIKTVDFSVDEGYFNKQVPDEEGWFLEKAGQTYTLSKTELQKDNMVYWGMDVPGNMESKVIDGEGTITFTETINFVQTIHIKAVVTFDNGDVQEKSLVYDTQKGTLTLTEQ